MELMSGLSPFDDHETSVDSFYLMAIGNNDYV